MKAHQWIPSWLLLGALLLSPVVAMAQDPVAGEHVLVTYMPDLNGPTAYRSRRTVELEVVMVNSDHILGRHRGSVMVIPLKTIRSLKRQVGVKPASAPAMAFGSAGGFLAGFLMGAISHSGSPTSTRSAVDDGLTAGVLFGAPAGALVAWVASRSRPIYEDIDVNRIRLRPRIVRTLTGGVGLGFSIPTP